MSTTARMVMKIIGASLAFAAFVCLLIGGWHDIGAGYTCVKNRMNKRFRSEYDDYDEKDSIGTSSISESPDLSINTVTAIGSPPWSFTA